MVVSSTARAPGVAIAPDPGLASRLARATEVRLGDGTAVELPRGTPCFVRSARDAGDLVELEIGRRRGQERRPAVERRAVAPRSAVEPAEARYEPVDPAAPLFARPASVADVVQRGDDGSCAAAAATISLLAAAPDRIERMFQDHGDGTVTVRLHERAADGGARPVGHRIEKSVLPGAPGALWWQLLLKGLAVHGWDGALEGETPAERRSHAEACPGGYCDDFYFELTGGEAFTHVVDTRDAGYVFSGLARRWVEEVEGDRPGRRLDAPKRRALASFLEGRPALWPGLLGGPGCDTRRLDTLLAEHGMRGVADSSGDRVDLDVLRRELCARTRAAIHALGSTTSSAYDPLERSLADAIETKLGAGRGVCFSTRASLPRDWPLGSFTKLADVTKGLSSPDYLASTLKSETVAGVTASHAYAVTGVEREGARVLFEVHDPLPSRGRRYLRLGPARVALPSSRRSFWLDLRDLSRYSAALYFQAE